MARGGIYTADLAAKETGNQNAGEERRSGQMRKEHENNYKLREATQTLQHEHSFIHEDVDVSSKTIYLF